MSAFLLTAFAISGCGGGGATSGAAIQSPVSIVAPQATPAGPGPPAGTAATTMAVIHLQIPLAGDTASNARRPRFVSPNTNGISVTVTQHGNATVVWSGVADVSGAGSCSTSGGARICTIAIVVPAGDYDFALKTYDSAPLAGSIPATAKLLAQSLVTQQVAAGQGTAINFVLSGLVSSVTALNANGAPAAYTSLPADGAVHTVGIGVAAADPSGSIITGSAPYASPLPVTLTEAGGGGHATLVVDGVAQGASGSLNGPSSTLALRYDGGGATGYGMTVTINGTVLGVSPMFLAPASATLAALNGTVTTTISEADPSSVNYTATASTTSCAGASFSNTTIAGPASGAILSLTIAAPGGTNETCTVGVSDNYGTQQTFVLRFTTAGPLSAGTIAFNGGSGSCTAGLQFTSAGQSAAFTLSDPGGTGFTGTSTQPSIVAVTLAGSAVTIAAQSSGTATVTLSDAQGNALQCPASVTIANGMVQ